MIDFVQKMHVFETGTFDIFNFGAPSRIQQVANPLNQYISRKYIPWLFLSF